MVPQTYNFRSVTVADRALLAGWLSQAHVRAWWGEAEPHDADALADPQVARWIVSLRDHPFAFLQDYSVHEPDHHFAHLPPASRGIDQFIGDPQMIGLGHGRGMIETRCRAMFGQGVPVIATDPHPENSRAIAVYQKLGFRVIGPPQQTPWGLILPMCLRPEALT